MPFSPWQAAQTWDALALPAAGSSARPAHGARRATATTADAARVLALMGVLPTGAAPRPRGSGRQGTRPLLRLLVRDAVERAREVVGHEQRAVGQHGHVHRTSEILARLLVEPALGERLGGTGGRAVRLHGREHDPGAHRGRAVPGAVLGAEDAAAVLLREHALVVERHAQVGRVRHLLLLGEDHVRRRLLVLVLDGADVAAPVPREAEALAGRGDPVDLAGRLVVAHAVDLVVREPELAVLRVEVHP